MSACYGHRPDLHSFPTRRSSDLFLIAAAVVVKEALTQPAVDALVVAALVLVLGSVVGHATARLIAREDERGNRSEEHTSELQSRQYLVCRLLLEKKKHRLPSHTG